MIVEMNFAQSVPNYTLTCAIGGVTYKFAMRWNARWGVWRMSVYDLDGNPIATGLTVVLGAFIGRRVAHPLFQGGAFVANDTSGDGAEATLDDLGTRVVVRYYPGQDLVGRQQLAADGVG